MKLSLSLFTAVICFSTAVFAESKCEKELRESKITPNGRPVLGRRTPNCNKDGSFQSIQCNGSIGFCYCVDNTTGEKYGEYVRGKPEC